MLQEQVVQEKAGTLSPLKQSGVIKIKYYSSGFLKAAFHSQMLWKRIKVLRTILRKSHSLIVPITGTVLQLSVIAYALL